MPARIRSSVDFPIPLGPTTPIRSRGPMVSVTSRSTSIAPWRRAMPAAVSTALKVAADGPQLREEALLERGLEVLDAVRAARPGPRADLARGHQHVVVAPAGERLVE